MKARRSAGIDFGTTNSALSVRDGADPQLAQFHLDGSPTDTFRSVLYFENASGLSKRGRVLAGPRAIERYLNEQEEGENPGRLIQSVKSLLASRVFTTTLVGGRRYTAEDLVTLIVKELRAESERHLGPLGDSVAVGRPVRFVGAESEEDETMGVTRLRSAFGSAGLNHITLELEPVAAAYFYESRLERDELILIADFGGGTSDFSLLPVGPAARKNRGKHAILATEGLPLAGDTFDARIVRHVVSPVLGEGTFYRSMHKRLPVPASLYRKLERWHHLSFLKSPETLRTLNSIRVEAEEPEKIEALIALVENDLGFHLHRAVQRTKYELSTSQESLFSFRHPAVTIEKRVRRSDFESWIEGDLAMIRGAVDKLLSSGNLSAVSLDRVFLTGGTSLVPAVRRIFDERFGAERVRAGNEFTSVAAGLALRAAQIRK